jgi:2,4-didehydro-3-deoxy-L-rhamnonate hydrolase
MCARPRATLSAFSGGVLLNQCNLHIANSIVAMICTRVREAFMIRIAGAALAAALLAAVAAAQTEGSFKLGRFMQGNRSFLGLVLDDRLIVDLGKVEGGAALPTDMKTLLAQYDRHRPSLQQIASRARTAGKAAYIYEVKAVDTLPPIPDPISMLNAAVNYTEHGNEMQTAGEPRPDQAKVTTPISGIWERRSGDKRQNPYLLPKLQAALAGDGDAIVLPPGRDKIDWECELAVIIGKRADHVSAEQANDYVFGYTLENDVSDRGGRADERHGSDWLLGKSHPSFAPTGPYLVPKEFVPNPQKLAITFTLNGKVMQDSNTDRMTHTVLEMVSYASNIITLHPGDIISTGSPAGVGTARATPIYMKAGDTSVCTIEKIGTLTNPVVASRAGTQ